jgi:hypothetical protein
MTLGKDAPSRTGGVSLCLKGWALRETYQRFVKAREQKAAEKTLVCNCCR